MFEARPIHFEKLCSVCLVGLGYKTGSLIQGIDHCVGVRKILLGHDIRLFFTTKRGWFRLQKLQCLPVSFQQSNSC